MSNRFPPPRPRLAGLCLALAVAGLAPPAAARDRGAVVQIGAGAEENRVLQAAPGAVAGYRRPGLAGRAASARAYPGYASATPGVEPGYAAVSDTPRRTMGGLFGYLAKRDRAAAAAPERERAPAAGLKPRRAAALLGRPVKPAPQAAAREFDPDFLPQQVGYAGGEAPGTIVIDTNARFLYLVGEGGTARRYGVGVGKPGFEWAGRHQVTRKSEWPTWTPPSQMREREAARGRILPVHMDGGPENPLGARAMYLGSTLYRIHGTNQPWSIGKAVSSGCIRMRNEDVTDLYDRVPVGTSVVVI